MTNQEDSVDLKKIEIRPYQLADRQSVREICCRTAFRNLGSDIFFEDRNVHADYWTRYYTDFRPEECSVITLDNRIVGYFFGCSDHSHFIRTMAFRIIPFCLIRVLCRLTVNRYGPRTRAYIRYILLKGLNEAPPIDYSRFPAHYHCNLLPEAYGLQLYSRLTLDFLDLLQAKGVHSLHGHITEPAVSGTWTRFEKRFISKVRAESEQGGGNDPTYFTAEVSTSLYSTILEDSRPMVNRVWGVQVSDYREWIRFVRDTYKL